MKHIIKLGVFILVAQVVFLNSCVEPDDLMTADAKTGGLVIPSTNLLLKAGANQSFDVVVEIPIGPGIQTLELAKVFSQGDTLLSNVAQLEPVDVSGANKTDTAFIAFSLAYPDLKDGLTLDGNPMPAEETGLGIGDYWTITYTSVMEDGRKVVNNATTVIAVSNQYAGYYQCDGYFLHPTPSSSREIHMEKFLAPISQTKCLTELGDLGASGYDIYIDVNPDNTCTVTKGVTCPTDVFMTAGETSYYEPATGKFYLWYYYVGASGNRVIDEIYTPLGK
jgi:hypothetical protein